MSLEGELRLDVSELITLSPQRWNGLGLRLYFVSTVT